MPTDHPVPSLNRLVVSLLGLALALWLLLALAAPAAAQSPAPATATPAPSTIATPVATPVAMPRATATPLPGPQPPGGFPGFGFDPFAFLSEQVQKALAELLANLIRPIRDSLRQQLDQQFNILTITRPEHTIGLAQVQQLHAVARLIANGSIALILIVGGYNLIFRRHLTGDDEEL